jgi:3-hydroxyisobutyrate dehydrogenase-like beta-hydroxyacid dehydrogenase
MTGIDSVAIIGFGEAGRALVSGWRSDGVGVVVSSFDVKSEMAGHRPAFEQAWREANVVGCPNVAEALKSTATVFCLVTADQAESAAEAAAAHLVPGSLWLDGNSCSPGAKRRAAASIEAMGGRYVDLAIMAPIAPRQHRTPMLIAGPHAAAAEAVLTSLKMSPAIAGQKVGEASAIKMMRSVMIKGLEALTAECLLGARRAGVEGAVLASLQASDPGFDWAGRSAYNLERMRHHGVRRSAEMREVAATLRELRLPDRMASATAEWQDQIGTLRTSGDDLSSQLDNLLVALD